MRRWAPSSIPLLEAETNLREFAAYSPIYEAQTREMLLAFCDNAGLAVEPAAEWGNQGAHECQTR